MASKPPADTPALRRQHARIAALARHVQHPGETMAAARAGLLDKFRAAVDPHGRLSEMERESRAARLRKAWLATVSYQGARARRGHPIEPVTLEAFLARQTPNTNGAASRSTEAAPQEERRVSDAPA